MNVEEEVSIDGESAIEGLPSCPHKAIYLRLYLSTSRSLPVTLLPPTSCTGGVPVTSAATGVGHNNNITCPINLLI